MNSRQGLLAAAILLSLQGCNSGKRERGGNESSASSGADNAPTLPKETSVLRPSGNPAERPGAKIYRPKALAHTRYDLGERSVIDIDTGDKLVLKSGHRGAGGTFGLSNEREGGIAGGLFRTWSNQEEVVYEVTALSSADDDFRRFLPRSDFDISRLAEMFRAYIEANYRVVQPQSKTGYRGTVLVIDSRPEQAGEIDQLSGKRMPS